MGIYKRNLTRKNSRRKQHNVKPYRHHTRHSVKGWSKKAPKGRQRTRMLKKCGRKCFLGPKKTFPICAKNTCRISKKGLEAAYMRAREYQTIKGTRKYKNIANKANRMLMRR